MLSQQIHFNSSIVVLILALAATGCSGAAATVSGTVTLDGQPLTKGDVSFHPEGGDRAPAYGQIDAQGRYSLRTGTEIGLPPGNYVAVVLATKDPPQQYDKTGAEIPPIPITPGKYGNVATSDLKVQVKPGKNDIPLSLQSAGK